jgi:signal transduction histidine kinase
MEACAQAGPSWIPALVTTDGDGFEAVTLGPGYRHPLEELARLSAGVEGAFLLALPDVLERVRVARHDINNPLAAAMAEAQLLRMDAEGEELIEALDAIQAQLRRIRDLVSSLHALRPPSRAPAPPSSPA